MVAQQYSGRISQLEEQNAQNYTKIVIFEKLCKDGNQFISFSELNAKDIIRKLKIVETSPEIIWEGLIEHFGFGYFNMVVENHFGIGADYREQIKDDAGKEIGQIKQLSME